MKEYLPFIVELFFRKNHLIEQIYLIFLIHVHGHDIIPDLRYNFTLLIEQFDKMRTLTTGFCA